MEPHCTTHGTTSHHEPHLATPRTASRCTPCHEPRCPPHTGPHAMHHTITPPLCDHYSTTVLPLDLFTTTVWPPLHHHPTLKFQFFFTLDSRASLFNPLDSWDRGRTIYEVRVRGRGKLPRFIANAGWLYAGQASPLTHPYYHQMNFCRFFKQSFWAQESQ